MNHRDHWSPAATMTPLRLQDDLPEVIPKWSATIIGTVYLEYKFNERM